MSAMTVGELIEKLSKFDSENTVYLAGDIYGGASLYVEETSEEIWYQG